MKRIGELNVQRGHNRYGEYISVRMGNFEDTWRCTATGRWYRDSRAPDAPVSGQRRRSTTYAQRIRAGGRRMKTQTFFEPEADRYAFDFRLCTSARGWAQVDTRQDAPYYGNWANPVTRQLLSYAEGDVTLRTFDSDAEFIAAVRDFVGWAGSDWRGIDCMCRDELTQRFESLGLADLLH